MQISRIYQKLHQFVVAASGLDSSKVIIANQTAPRPLKPFITVTISSFRKVSTPIAKAIDDEGVEEAVISMVALVSFQSFSDKLFEAEELLDSLHSKFSTSLQDEIFKGQLAYLRTLKNVSSISAILNEQIESRAIVEIEVAFNKYISHETGLIETVHLNNLINNEKITMLQRN